MSDTARSAQAGARPASLSKPAGDIQGAKRTPAIELSGVHKRFKAVHAVRGVDLLVPQGEIVALLGPNGAGKSTTIDMVLGLSEPDEGSARIFSMSPRQAVSQGAVSAVLQNGGLLKDFTVEETLRYVAALYRRPRPVEETLEVAGLGQIRARRVGKCSGGERQRLRFAMALLADSRLLILDEPTEGMDVESRRRFWETIRGEGLAGTTVVFATHYLEEADAFADRVVLMRKGKIVADGSAAEVKAMAAGRTIRATLPGADRSELGQLEGVGEVELRGDSVLIRSTDTDAVARHLLNNTAARDLEISSSSLEDAFIALTTDEESEDSP